MEWLLEKLYEGQEGRSYFATGTAMHKGFEWMVKGMDLETATEQVLDMVDYELNMYVAAGLGMMWTKSRPEDRWEEDIVRLMASWYANVHPSGEFQRTEFSSLEWPPETEVWLNVKTDDFHLKTQVDAVYTTGEGFPFIVDWKTGANKGSDDRQLHVYWWAHRQMFPEMHEEDRGEIYAAFYYVHHNEWVEPKMPYPGDEAIYSMIAEAERRRRLGEYHVEPSWKCKYCRMTEVCPAWADNDSLPWPKLMELAKTIDWTGVNE